MLLYLGLPAIRLVNVLIGCLFQGQCSHFGIMISYVIVSAYHQTRVCFNHCITLLTTRCVRLNHVNNATLVHVCLCHICLCSTVCRLCPLIHAHYVLHWICICTRINAWFDPSLLLCPSVPAHTLKHETAVCSINHCYEAQTKDQAVMATVVHRFQLYKVQHGLPFNDVLHFCDRN